MAMHDHATHSSVSEQHSIKRYRMRQTWSLIHKAGAFPLPPCNSLLLSKSSLFSFYLLSILPVPCLPQQVSTCSAPHHSPVSQPGSLYLPAASPSNLAAPISINPGVVREKKYIKIIIIKKNISPLMGGLQSHIKSPKPNFPLSLSLSSYSLFL